MAWCASRSAPGGLARDVPITNPLEQNFWPANAANIQENARSLIPASDHIVNFARGGYAELRSGHCSHGERHAYARGAVRRPGGAPCAGRLPNGAAHHRAIEVAGGGRWISRPASGSPPNWGTAASMLPGITIASSMDNG